ncbi:dihydrolipoamide acetyltransferase family protein [Halobacillus litoralis]|uniref:Dihydrolipoamide acetyltransferase component of pyruvate dehydrogenase complex n=1 Tax=Halobacillus litoralis TaxID=45668 RepID=A0A410MHU8_9BACI|nr:dihydrolipoamide acetyltransferase family protein [Halobacillus litoralis]QAS54281.1 dihydrolipoyllysine acetyltransferase [Halobacillus litoralis]
MEVKLHDIGEGMHEAEILHYFVEPGQNVKNDEPLVEIQTDKMTAELTAPADGVVEELRFHIGDVVEVGTTILSLRTDDYEETQTMIVQREQKQPMKTGASSTSTKPYNNENPHKRVQASPHTRRVAREQGVNIEEVTGSGPSGRITDEDIYQFLKAPSKPVSEKSTEEAQPKEQEERKFVPFRGRRKQIAKKMVKSLHTAPHVTHFDEVMMSDLLDLKQQLKQEGTSISVAAFFIKAIQMSLEEHAIFNSKLNEEQERIELEPHFNIGLATDTEEGLIVPVIKNVEDKSIELIHKEMKELTAKAKENQLSAKELSGGTFTMSNVGPLGSTGATPILNYPETGLIAFHKTKRMPVVVNEEIVIRDVMNISFIFDHRVADGAKAATFVNRFIDYIHHPSKMLVKLV